MTGKPTKPTPQDPVEAPDDNQQMQDGGANKQMGDSFADIQSQETEADIKPE